MIHCPQCNSTELDYDQKTKTYACNECGYEWISVSGGRGVRGAQIKGLEGELND